MLDTYLRNFKLKISAFNVSAVSVCLAFFYHKKIAVFCIFLLSQCFKRASYNVFNYLTWTLWESTAFLFTSNRFICQLAIHYTFKYGYLCITFLPRCWILYS